MLLPVLLVLANTGFQLLTSRLAKTEDPRTTHLYTGVVGLGLASLALPWAWQALPGSTWLVLAMMGGFSTLGHYLLILAFGRAPVAVLTPYLYLQIAFATLFAWVMFQHLPDAWSFAGLALVTVGGVLGTWLTARETRASAAQQQHGLVDA
jgi:drug/metabolite transporter (DMT)-like permease